MMYFNFIVFTQIKRMLLTVYGNFVEVISPDEGREMCKSQNIDPTSQNHKFDLGIIQIITKSVTSQGGGYSDIFKHTKARIHFFGF